MTAGAGRVDAVRRLLADGAPSPALDALVELSARLELAMDAADIGSFEWDPGTQELVWDQRLIEMFGYEEGSFDGTIDSFFARVHPGDRERVAAGLQRAVDAQSEFAMEYRIELPDGRTRWISARGRMLGDAAGSKRLFGAAFDTTEVRRQRDQIARLLTTMTDAFFSVDREWRFTYLNEQAERLLGRPHGELIGRGMWEEFPAASNLDFARQYRHAMRTGDMVTFVEHYPEPLDKFFEVRAWPGPDGLSVFFHDVTEQRRAAQQLEQAYNEAATARARLTLLADMTQALVSTLDVDEAMTRLLRLLVPRLCTWASVTLVDETWQLRHSVARHSDPAFNDDIARFASLHMEVATQESKSLRVARTGETVLVPRLTPQQISRGWRGDELTEVLERIGLASVIVVPLQGRERVLGVLIMAGDQDRPPFTESDLETAREIGQRAGLVIDNAQLFARQRTTAEMLQRHLLPALPDPDHLELAARYLPAGEAAQVGGDFYWGALQPDGAMVVAIGDVSGHDLAATSWQAQLAPLLRGFAFEDTDGPASVLRRVDGAMAGLQIDTMATVVIARLEQTEHDRQLRAGGGRRLRWSNAGHPPPMLLRADGRVETLEAPDGDPDLLLGLDPDTERRDHDIVIGPGDTVLLYTDGLVERRGSPLEAGLVKLRQALSSLGPLPAEELCDAVLTRMLADYDALSAEDDVAMLAIRANAEPSAGTFAA